MMQSQYPVPHWMFGAVQNTESGNDPNAVSPAGAVGLMQTVPATLRDPGYGVQPAQNNSSDERRRVGQDYLQAMFNHFHGDPQASLMAYNWGPGNVDKLQGGTPLQIPAETQAYVGSVMGQAPSLPQGAQYAQNAGQMNDASAAPSKMDLMLEAEKRGILPQDKAALLAEARSRRLIPNVTAQQTGQPSSIWDAAKSLGGGLERGVAGTAMMLPNLMNAAVAGPQYLGRGIADTIEGNPTDKNFQPWQPFFSSEDALHMLPTDLQPHNPQTGVGVVADMVGQLTGGIGAAKGMQGVATPSAPTASPDEIKAFAKTAYDNSEKMGGQIPIQEMRQTVNQLASNKSIGQQTTRGQQFAGENPATQTMEKLQEAVKDNQPWTIQDANEIHDAISNDISKARRSGDYASARQLTLIKQGLRDTYSNYAQNNPQQAAGFNEWLRGDKLYSAGSAGEEIQDIITNGQRADVPSTAIKNGFKNFVKNDDNRIGLTDEEWTAAERAADYGVITPILKTLGSRMSGHITGALAGLLEGGMTGGALGYMAGNAAIAPFRWGANALQAGRGQNVVNMISQRPIVQQAMGVQPPSAMPSFMPPVATSMGLNAVNRQYPPIGFGQ